MEFAFLIHSSFFIQPKVTRWIQVRKWLPSGWVTWLVPSSLHFPSQVQFPGRQSIIPVVFVHLSVVCIQVRFSLIVYFLYLFFNNCIDLLLFSGVLIILAITVLTPYFYFIPKTCLAAVIICAVLFMVEAALMKLVWKSRSN